VNCFYSILLLLCLLDCLPITGLAQHRPQTASKTTAPARTPAQYRLPITIVDETGNAVPAALVALWSGDKVVAQGESDYAGKLSLRIPTAGDYALRVQRAGFYRLDVPHVAIGQTAGVDVTLYHVQEIKETVDVVASPPAIDPNRTANTETLNTLDILNIPYPTSRRIQNILPYLPGVVQDQYGDIHIEGASTTQTLTVLDGFNISRPSTTFTDMRVSADAVRSIDVEGSRTSAEYGKGTSILGLATGMGDDRFRFSATNFFPSFRTNKGFYLNNWVPRATFSGPIKRGKAWFFEAPDVEYDVGVVQGLPSGADRVTTWKASNLTKAQVNLATGNIFSTELLVNGATTDNSGLSAFVPVATTTTLHDSAYMASVKDQQYFPSGILLEGGIAFSSFNDSAYPKGNEPYVLVPSYAQGSYFQTTHGNARRIQGISNIYFAPFRWHGKHEVKTGIDLDALTDTRWFFRNPITILRQDGTLVRRVDYPGIPSLSETDFIASAYVQDRWSPTDRLLVESGLRLDWDQIIRDPVLAPRVAAAYLLSRNHETKLSAGIGIDYISTDLDLISRPEAGLRLDYFYGPNGTTLLGPPVPTSFVVNRNALAAPTFLNTSVSLEHRLPRSVYLRLEYINKREHNGLAFVNTAGPFQSLGTFVLANTRRDKYDSFQATIRHTFKNTYPLLLSYTRSSVRTNTLIDFSQDNYLLGPQSDGVLPWDTPNRILAWGWTPFFKKIQLGYAFDYRDGLPFTVVNQNQQIVGKPNTLRFPTYASLNISAERRFHVFGYIIALRGTMENITNRQNPRGIQNNIDSPQFLDQVDPQHRTFTGRIRFLGRVKGKNDTQAATAPQTKP
jgi:hypothetical protein